MSQVAPIDLPAFTTGIVREDRPKHDAEEAARAGLRESPAELQRLRFNAGQRWAAPLGCVNGLMKDCCRDDTMKRERQARWHVATLDLIRSNLRSGGQEALEAAPPEQRAKIKAALTDIEIHGPDLEAVVYTASTEVDAETLPCAPNKRACLTHCTGGWCCAVVRAFARGQEHSFETSRDLLLLSSFRRFKPQLTRGAWCIIVLAAMVWDPVIGAAIVLCIATYGSFICILDAIITCCAGAYLRLTCKSDAVCRFKRTERIYLLTGVAYFAGSNSAERAAVRGWMYQWQRPSLSWWPGVRSLWCPPVNNQPAALIFSPGMTRNYYTYGSPRLFLDDLSAEELRRLAEYDAMRESVRAEMLALPPSYEARRLSATASAESV